MAIRQPRPELCEPARYADLTASALAAEVVIRRFDGATTPRQASVFKWPKPGGAYRLMCNVDPYDGLLYHSMVGRLRSRIEARVDHSIAYAARTTCDRGCARCSHPAWALSPHRAGAAGRRNHAAGLLRKNPTFAITTLDVRQFFPAVGAGAVADALATLPRAEREAESLVGWLTSLQQIYNVRGLPIGEDGSSVLANFVLSAVDDLPNSWPTVRYMDDIWVFHAPELHDRVVARYGEHLDGLGLSLNEAKTGLFEGEDAWTLIQREEYGGGSIFSGLPTGEALSVLRDAKSWTNHPDVVRASLRAIQGDARGVPLVLAEGGDLSVAIDDVVAYLRSVCENKLHRKQAVEVIFDTLPSVVSNDNQFEAIVRLQSVEPAKLDARKAAILMDLVHIPDPWARPLRLAAAGAWNRADGWKPKAAVTAIESAPDLSTRRALAVGLKNRLPRRSGSLIGALQRVDPDLAPTIAWIEAAA